MARDQVTSDERGVVRVYAIDATGAGLKPWLDPKAQDWPLPEALGVEALADEDVQVFPASDVAEMGLGEFLSLGYGAEAAALDGVETPERGGVAVIRSAAFGGEAVELAPVAPLSPIVRFREPQAVETFAQMPKVESAKPSKRKKPKDEPKAEDVPKDEKVIESFRADRSTYIRAHLWMAALGAAAAPAVLWLIGAGDAWVGIPAAIGAIAVRGFYLASEELGTRWDLTRTELRVITAQGEIGRRMGLGEVQTVRTLGSTVQMVSKGGDKLLLKYMDDSVAVQARLRRAAKLRET